MKSVARGLRVSSTSIALGLALSLTTIAHGQYHQHNLVSDGFTAADNIDPNLKNPWGIAASPTGPFWVSDNGTGLSTLYNSSGTPQPLVVTIPPAGSGVPTGVVFNPTNDFQITAGGLTGKAVFIFAGEDGSLSGWNPSVGVASATNPANAASPGPVYKGIAMGNNGVGNELYTADFTKGTIDMFNSSFVYDGSLSDTTVDPGFSPFNVANIVGKLYVSYAKVKAGTHDDEAGAGNGFIDVFNLDGTLDKRLVSHGALNSPWGMVQAPSSGFGAFDNALLVGNFGDGTINAFDPNTGAQLGTLTDAQGHPIVIGGLWGLTFGNGGSGGDLGKLYFTAGANDEADGLLGSLQAVPEPSVFLALGAGLIPLLRRRRR